MQSNTIYGQQLRDEGIQRAADHAEAKSPGWGEEAYKHLKSFLQITPGPFLVEELRAYAERHGLPAPPDQRSWGAVTVRARNERLITHGGYTSSKNKQAHCRPTTIWNNNLKAA